MRKEEGGDGGKVELEPALPVLFELSPGRVGSRVSHSVRSPPSPAHVRMLWASSPA